ncbi:MAG: GNAT family N-acetyltransferase [bacterium]
MSAPRGADFLMPDMLVNLLKLPPFDATLVEMARAGVVIRQPQPFELTPVRSFIEQKFSLAWADETSVGFAHQPVSVFIATSEQAIIGFAAYECTRKTFFGPTGVAEGRRGQGIGKALLLASLWGLRESGYVYGIIGGVGPADFYQKTVGAVVIPDSDPGIYTDLLK